MGKLLAIIACLVLSGCYMTRDEVEDLKQACDDMGMGYALTYHDGTRHVARVWCLDKDGAWYDPEDKK